jgi:hypothetical protein
MWSIAPIFRGPFLEKVARGLHVPVLLELSRHYAHLDPPSPSEPLSQWFDFFYSVLEQNYRCEYVYKNTIATRLFLSRHSLNSSFMTDELRSAGSRADIAILNGTSTIYEIKTQYDSFDRLEGQIADYKKVFDRLFLVTTEAKAEIALNSLESSVGIIAMRENGALSVFREADSNKHNTDPAAIFDCMRREEYSTVLRNEFGFLPQVPNSRLYTVAKEMFCTMSPEAAHDWMVHLIKKRGKSLAFSHLINEVPSSLKHACLSFSKSHAMARTIAARLRGELENEEVLSFPSRQAQWLMALRDLSVRIAEGNDVVPIVEPVRDNSTTRISLDRFEEASMPFLFICNPTYGQFAGNAESLFTGLIEETMMESDYWTPALQIRRESSAAEISSFLERYEQYEVAIVYNGLPVAAQAVALLSDERIVNHVFVQNRVNTNYVDSVTAEKRVMIFDRFQRQPRNADYPDQELFTDWNTLAGNPNGLDFGDYSVVGDYYSDDGGPAYAVALHHIHFQGQDGPLDISHFISDRTETTADTPGKILEAMLKLVGALDGLLPNDTQACEEYREIQESEVSKGLGYMKRLAIKHHIEVMLDGGIQL